ncbi:MAG TPA: DUF4142 domain-containing protein [Adhaeribacter sp.]|nr:DUF4142 domain-containing protein [Adhaeribacter sp.]
MENLKFALMAGCIIIFGLAGCSSTNTETTTPPTSEEVTTDRTTAPSSTEIITGIPAPGRNDEAGLSEDTTSFYAVATSNSILEIQTGVQARTRATHPEVKKFAEQMVTEHTRSGEELKSLTGAKNLIAPNKPIPTHQRMINRLDREEDADEYDEEYMEMQVLAHRQAVELFERAAKNESDPDLKAYAARMLPTLKNHLEMAKRTKDLVD